VAGDITVTIASNLLPRLARELRPRAARIVRKTALDIEAGAKRRSRVDTGAMQNAWQTEMTGETEATVSNAVEHVLYNEFGTVRMGAQPMATPAAEAARGPFVEAMRKLLD
jgi:HK97 gp10 family phage protein